MYPTSRHFCHIYQTVILSSIFMSTRNFIFTFIFCAENHRVGVDEVTNLVHLFVCTMFWGWRNGICQCFRVCFFLLCSLPHFRLIPIPICIYTHHDVELCEKHDMYASIVEWIGPYTLSYGFNMVFVFAYYFHRFGPLFCVFASVCLLTGVMLYL